jgi:hypothetical protein
LLEDFEEVQRLRRLREYINRIAGAGPGSILAQRFWAWHHRWGELASMRRANQNSGRLMLANSTQQLTHAYSGHG